MPTPNLPISIPDLCAVCCFLHHIKSFSSFLKSCSFLAQFPLLFTSNHPISSPNLPLVFPEEGVKHVASANAQDISSIAVQFVTSQHQNLGEVITCSEASHRGKNFNELRTQVKVLFAQFRVTLKERNRVWKKEREKERERERDLITRNPWL
ncbi:hypothetical protein FHG87_007815 [Trinorchestia longiramus]|nr:hypothetical protein FHG87_007815 [Trinorchestia longiramus]